MGSNKLETVANCALIGLCLLIGYQFAHRPTPPTPPDGVYKIGDAISVPGVDFAKSTQTLLLVVRKDCHFCEASMPFYKTLSAKRPAEPLTRLVALTSDDVEVSQRNFKEHDVVVDGIIKVQLAGLKVTGTPTAILVDRAGTVQGVWVGLLNTDRQSDLERKLGVS